MSHAQLKAYGADGRAELPRLDPSAENILTCCDPGHFMYGKVNLHRYQFSEGGLADDAASAWSEKRSNPHTSRNAWLVESIRDKGVQEPGKIWVQTVDGKKIMHVISGTRRVLALRIANQLRLAEDMAPFRMEFYCDSRWTIDQATEKWRLSNQGRVDNDIMTRLEGARMDIDRGVSLDTAAEVWEFEPSFLTKALKPGGLIDASPEVKAALATGEIRPGRALVIAKMPLNEQADELVGKKKRSKSAEPKAIRVPVLKMVSHALRDDKSLDGLSARDFLGIVLDPGGYASDSDGTDIQLVKIRQLIADASKPGRKSEKKLAAEPKSGSEFTEAERAMIHANNNKDIDAIEAEAEKGNGKRASTRAVIDELETDDEEE